MSLRALILGIAFALALVACGGSADKSGSSDTQPLAEKPEKAGPRPSEAAKMICSSYARPEIGASLGIRETRVTVPTWKDHVYGCTYIYEAGSVALSVKELSSERETSDYFDGLARKLGRDQPLFGLGQGAFITKDGDAVVRKDYKVLLVDVRQVPKSLRALMRRSDVAQNITVVIMGCWTAD